MFGRFALRVLYLVLISLPFSFTKTRTNDNNCYQPLILDLKWTDSCPKYCLNMSYSKEGTTSSVATVREAVQIPIGHLAIMQTDVNGKSSTLYNLTAKLCDIKVILSKIPIMATIMDSYKKSNYTFPCPIPVGIHYMANINVNQRSPLMMLMYRQRTKLIVSGGLSKELPDKSRVRLTAFNITGKIIKRICKKN